MNALNKFPSQETESKYSKPHELPWPAAVPNDGSCPAWELMRVVQVPHGNEPPVGYYVEFLEIDLWASVWVAWWGEHLAEIAWAIVVEMIGDNDEWLARTESLDSICLAFLRSSQQKATEITVTLRRVALLADSRPAGAVHQHRRARKRAAGAGLDPVVIVSGGGPREREVHPLRVSIYRQRTRCRLRAP